MNKLVRIGTRGSALALWQARQVQHMLETLGLRSELVPISSSGDKELQKPLYEMGVQGIFTKELDVALLEGQIDVAVHSMKDVPTQLPKGIAPAFIPKRGPVADVFISKNDAWEDTKSIVATSSLRRAAQWLHKYPHHSTIDIRGNVPHETKKIRNPGLSRYHNGHSWSDASGNATQTAYRFRLDGSCARTRCFVGYCIGRE
jgi:hydroxymethylbilane synthase